MQIKRYLQILILHTSGAYGASFLGRDVFRNYVIMVMSDHLKHLAYEWLFSICNKHLYLDWLLSRNNQHNLCQMDVEQLNIVNGCSQEITNSQKYVEQLTLISRIV